MIDYYEAPSQEIFEEIKAWAIEVWKAYDDTHWYSSGKVSQIRDLENISDNAMYMVAMFDIHNRNKLYWLVSYSARKFIIDRINY